MTDPVVAAAIGDTAMRPRHRFVALRSNPQPGAVMRHRVREQLVVQGTALINALRGHLSKIGLVAAQGRPARLSTEADAGGRRG